MTNFSVVEDKKRTVFIIPLNEEKGDKYWWQFWKSGLTKKQKQRKRLIEIMDSYKENTYENY